MCACEVEVKLHEHVDALVVCFGYANWDNEKYFAC